MKLDFAQLPSDENLPQNVASRSIQPAILWIIIPTFNERDNVSELIQRLTSALATIDWEAVFVDDDSTDGTVDAVRELCRTNIRVRLIHRIGRRGLASAVVEGVQSTSSPYIAVIDADLQHDEKLLPSMLETLRSNEVDIVVGSRYIAEQGLGDLVKRRQRISQIATRLARLTQSANLTDPMSGFFMLKREAFDRSRRNLSSLGYKILLDILLSSKPQLAIAEVPYVFKNRIHGESKLDSVAVWEYLMLLLDKTVGRFLPIRFIVFTVVGGMGVVIHMLTLLLATKSMSAAFLAAQTLATILAMTFNFFANNFLTYRDKRIKG